MVAKYDEGIISVYAVDSDGKTDPNSRQPFVSYNEVQSIVFGPGTGDLLFVSWGLQQTGLAGQRPLQTVVTRPAEEGRVIWMDCQCPEHRQVPPTATGKNEYSDVTSLAS